MNALLRFLCAAGALLFVYAASGVESSLSTPVRAQTSGDCSGPAFSVPREFIAGPPWLGPMQAGDLTGDGAPEIVIVDKPRDAVIVMRNDGAGRFESRMSIPTGIAPQDVAIGDFTSDGLRDVAVAVGDSSSPLALLVLPGDGSGGFTDPISTPLDARPLRMVAGFFNGDDRLDLVVTTNTDEMVMLLGDGLGGFALRPPVPTAYHLGWIVGGDFNEDGRLDIAAMLSPEPGMTDGHAGLFLGDGLGGLGPPARFEAGPVLRAILPGDFNADGHLDLALANRNDGSNSTVSVLLGDGAGGFASEQVFEAGRMVEWGAAGDFNRDGRTDVLVVNSGLVPEGGVSVLMATADGLFAPQVKVPLVASGDGNPEFPITADVDRDGRIDILGLDPTWAPGTELSQIAIARNICGLGGANLTIGTTDTPDPVAVNATLHYRMFVENRGPDAATGVRVTDVLPPAFELVAASTTRGSCSPVAPPLPLDRTVACDVGALDAGNAATIDLLVKPLQSGALVNTATVSANEPDPDPANSAVVETQAKNFGGLGFGLTSTQSGVTMTWTYGADEPGYKIGVYTTNREGDNRSMYVLPSRRTLIPSHAASYAVALSPDPNVYRCYLLAPVDSGLDPLALSDMLCIMTGYATATGSAADFTIRLNQSSTAALGWTTPGGQTGYALLAYPMNGNAPRHILLPGDATEATDETGWVTTCYVLAAMSGSTTLGATNVLCAVPGFTTFLPHVDGLRRSGPDQN